MDVQTVMAHTLPAPRVPRGRRRGMLGWARPAGRRTKAVALPLRTMERSIRSRTESRYAE